MQQRMRLLDHRELVAEVARERDHRHAPVLGLQAAQDRERLVPAAVVDVEDFQLDVALASKTLTSRWCVWAMTSSSLKQGTTTDSSTRPSRVSAEAVQAVRESMVIDLPGVCRACDASCDAATVSAQVR